MGNGIFTPITCNGNVMHYNFSKILKSNGIVMHYSKKRCNGKVMPLLLTKVAITLLKSSRHSLLLFLIETTDKGTQFMKKSLSLDFSSVSADFDS